MDRFQSGVGPGHALDPLLGSWHPVTGSVLPLAAMTAGLISLGVMAWREARLPDELRLPLPARLSRTIAPQRARASGRPPHSLATSDAVRGSEVGSPTHCARKLTASFGSSTSKGYSRHPRLAEMPELRVVRSSLQCGPTSEKAKAWESSQTSSSTSRQARSESSSLRRARPSSGESKTAVVSPRIFAT